MRGANSRIEDHVEVRAVGPSVTQLIFSEGLMEGAQELAARKLTILFGLVWGSELEKVVKLLVRRLSKLTSR